MVFRCDNGQTDDVDFDLAMNGKVWDQLPYRCPGGRHAKHRNSAYEAASMWESVDFVQSRVFVIESNYEGRQNAPKTRASRRMVFLDDLAMSALSRIKPSSVQPDEFVFHTERGTPLNPNNVLNRILHPACEREVHRPQNVPWKI
jgi:integrase